MKPVFIACTACILLAGVACSGGQQKPARKKMPDFNRLGISESFYDTGTPAGLAGFPFSTGEMDVKSGSTQSTFHAVALPDASFDSLAMGIIASHASTAISLLGEWSKQAEKGVVIDLRSPKSESGQRADYILQRTGEFSIPVVFLWDRSSEARAAAFIGVMRSLQAVECKHTGSYSGNGQQDCFY